MVSIFFVLRFSCLFQHPATWKYMTYTDDDHKVVLPSFQSGIWVFFGKKWRLWLGNGGISLVVSLQFSPSTYRLLASHHAVHEASCYSFLRSTSSQITILRRAGLWAQLLHVAFTNQDWLTQHTLRASISPSRKARLLQSCNSIERKRRRVLKIDEYSSDFVEWTAEYLQKEPQDICRHGQSLCDLVSDKINSSAANTKARRRA